MNRQPLWHVPILTGLVLGIALGLTYSWLIAPVQFYDTAPDKLRADLKQEYILLICQTYAADGDWAAAQARLAELDDPDIAATILSLAEQAIEQGKPVSTIRQLARVASQLGPTSTALAFFLPTVPPTPSPTPAPVMATFTPRPQNLPTVTPTPRPTLTPSPFATSRPALSPTPRLNYQLLVQQRICDPERDEPLLQILVRDSQGDDISGAEVLVSWSEEEYRFFTGFKPELGRGYVDLVMQPNTSYGVWLADGSDQVSGIQTGPCSSSQGPRLLSYRLVFEETKAAN